MKELQTYPAVLAAAKSILNRDEYLRDLAIQIQQIPSPTDDEKRWADSVAAYFTSLGLEDVMIDDLQNVYVRIAGVDNTEQGDTGLDNPNEERGNQGTSLLVSAHIDTVFQADTDLTIRVNEADKIVHGPSIGDNSAGVAALLALAEVLASLDAPPVDIWLVANTGEEGLGDLRGMKGAMNRLGDQIGACIVIEGMGLSRVVHQGLGSRRYEISVQAPGGHSWSDFGTPSAIHLLTNIAAEITQWEVPAEPRTTYNIGRISGGRSVNTIAQNASFELDLRSEDGTALQALIQKVDGLIERYQSAEIQNAGITVTHSIIGDRPSGMLDKEHPLVLAAVDALKASGLKSASLRTSSTDANIPLSRQIPAVCVGVTEGGGAHRMEEWINYGLMPLGVHHIILLAWWSALWLGGKLEE